VLPEGLIVETIGQERVFVEGFFERDRGGVPVEASHSQVGHAGVRPRLRNDHVFPQRAKRPAGPAQAHGAPRGHAVQVEAQIRANGEDLVRGQLERLLYVAVDVELEVGPASRGGGGSHGGRVVAPTPVII
jgi:hypothetical protein